MTEMLLLTDDNDAIKAVPRGHTRLASPRRTFALRLE
jgi:hypothetical protein